MKTRTLWKVDKEYQERFEVWYRRRIEISWTDRVKKKKYYTELRKTEISHKQIKRRKANWIGHILRSNCLLKHFLQGKNKIDGKMKKKT